MFYFYFFGLTILIDFPSVIVSFSFCFFSCFCFISMDYFNYMAEPTRGWEEPYFHDIGRFRPHSND